LDKIESIQLGPMSLKPHRALSISPITVFQDVVSNFVESVEKINISTVVAIDELQNILNFSD